MHGERWPSGGKGKGRQLLGEENVVDVASEVPLLEVVGVGDEMLMERWLVGEF